MSEACFEKRILAILGKNIDDPEVQSFMLAFSKNPEIDMDNLGLPDDNISYEYYDDGVCLLFLKKTRMLHTVRTYFIDHDEFKGFRGYFNDDFDVHTVKEDIILKKGIPNRENNKEYFSFGVLTPKFIVYDHDKYTIHYQFYGERNQLSCITMMAPEAAPGREERTQKGPFH